MAAAVDIDDSRTAMIRRKRQRSEENEDPIPPQVDRELESSPAPEKRVKLQHRSSSPPADVELHTLANPREGFAHTSEDSPLELQVQVSGAKKEKGVQKTVTASQGANVTSEATKLQEANDNIEDGADFVPFDVASESESESSDSDSSSSGISTDDSHESGEVEEDDEPSNPNTKLNTEKDGQGIQNGSTLAQSLQKNKQRVNEIFRNDPPLSSLDAGSTQGLAVKITFNEASAKYRGNSTVPVRGFNTVKEKWKIWLCDLLSRHAFEDIKRLIIGELTTSDSKSVQAVVVFNSADRLDAFNSLVHRSVLPAQETGQLTTHKATSQDFAAKYGAANKMKTKFVRLRELELKRVNSIQQRKEKAVEEMPHLDGAHSDQPINQEAADTIKLNIKNLPFAFTDDDLKTVLNNYNVNSCSINRHHRTKRSLGHGSVIVPNREEAWRIIKEVNGKDIGGRKTSISFASSMAQPPSQTPLPLPNVSNAQKEQNETLPEPKEQLDADKAVASIPGISNGNSGEIAVLPSPLPAEGSRTKLSQLSASERELQARYWGLQDLEGPVRCPMCSQKGHMDESCPSRTCAHCQAQGKHFSNACPSYAKCKKCRLRGHTADDCPSKLKRTDADKLVCDLCGEQGHFEESCSSLWRTFKLDPNWKPSEAREVIIACYQCGSNTHWGDDCPMRRKGTVPSTFSSKYASKYIFVAVDKTSNGVGSAKESIGFSIKGQGSGPADPMSDSEDFGNFQGRQTSHTSTHSSIRINLAPPTGPSQGGLASRITYGNPDVPPGYTQNGVGGPTWQPPLPNEAPPPPTGPAFLQGVPTGPQGHGGPGNGPPSKRRRPNKKGNKKGDAGASAGRGKPFRRGG